MHLKLAHTDTVSAVTQKVKSLQETKSFPELQILILEIPVALFEIFNQMLLST